MTLSAPRHLETHALQMVVQRRPGEFLGQCSCRRYDEGPSLDALLALVKAHRHVVGVPAQR